MSIKFITSVHNNERGGEWMMKKNQNNPNMQPNKNMQRQSEEFGYETDVSEVQKQNAKAEQKKAQASGNYANKNNQNASE